LARARVISGTVERFRRGDFAEVLLPDAKFTLGVADYLPIVPERTKVPFKFTLEGWDFDSPNSNWSLIITCEKYRGNCSAMHCVDAVLIARGSATGLGYS